MKAKLSVTVCFISICTLAYAQKITFPFGGQYDESQPLHLGFFFTSQISYYKATKSVNWLDPKKGEPGQLVAISTPSALGGVGFGIPIDLRLGENANFIVRPTYLIFANQAVYYHYNDGETAISVSKYHKEEFGPTVSAGQHTDKNFFAYEMPVLLKFKSDMKQLYGEDRYRAYLVGGFKFSRNIGRNKYYDQLTQNPPERMPLIVKPYYFAYDIGVGVDLFFEYFKMSAELKWSQTMNSVLDKKLDRGQNPFMDPIDKLLLRSLQFSLIFE